jgi:NAD(P)-dependent dehydrogenase (short-subunit alcohol dehydrogenase family)
MIDLSRLDDKSVFITGAADGIGRALAEAFAQAGAKLFLVDVAVEKLTELADRLGARYAVCDVTDAAAMEAVVERAWEELGALDVFCANAGVIQPGSILEASSEDIAFQFDVNVWGMLNSLRPHVRRLRAAGRPGHLLLTGSEHSLSNPAYLSGFPTHVYNLTKHCVLAMADVLRAEVQGDSIAVSVLCPGPVRSGLGENSLAFRPDRYGEPASPMADPVATGQIDAEEARTIAALYRDASEAAAIAIAGLRDGLFVIPTHEHLLDDARARFLDIERGFDLLKSG